MESHNEYQQKQLNINPYIITERAPTIIMDESIAELVARLQEEWREKMLHDKEATQVTRLKRKYKKH